MSTRPYESESLPDDAHQTAGQVGRAFDYVLSKGGPLRERAATVAKTARRHPAYTWMAIGLVAFGLGFFLRGNRANKNNQPGSPGVSPEQK